MASGPDQNIAKSRKEGVKMGRPAAYRKSEDDLLILDDPLEALFRTGLFALLCFGVVLNTAVTSL